MQICAINLLCTDASSTYCHILCIALMRDMDTALPIKIFIACEFTQHKNTDGVQLTTIYLTISLYDNAIAKQTQ